MVMTQLGSGRRGLDSAGASPRAPSTTSTIWSLAPQSSKTLSGEPSPATPQHSSGFRYHRRAPVLVQRRGRLMQRFPHPIAGVGEFGRTSNDAEIGPRAAKRRSEERRVGKGGEHGARHVG